MQVLRFWAKAMRPPTLDVKTVLQRVWSPSETEIAVALADSFLKEILFYYCLQFEMNLMRKKVYNTKQYKRLSVMKLMLAALYKKN